MQKNLLIAVLSFILLQLWGANASIAQVGVNGLLVQLDPSAFQENNNYLATSGEAEHYYLTLEPSNPLMPSFDWLDETILSVAEESCFYPSHKLLLNGATYVISEYCQSIKKYELQPSAPYLHDVWVETPSDLMFSEDLAAYLSHINQTVFTKDFSSFYENLSTEDQDRLALEYQYTLPEDDLYCFDEVLERTQAVLLALFADCQAAAISEDDDTNCIAEADETNESEEYVAQDEGEVLENELYDPSTSLAETEQINQEEEEFEEAFEVAHSRIADHELYNYPEETPQINVEDDFLLIQSVLNALEKEEFVLDDTAMDDEEEAPQDIILALFIDELPLDLFNTQLENFLNGIYMDEFFEVWWGEDLAKDLR